MTPVCEYMLWGGSLVDPPEYCPEDAEPGEEYCLGHLMLMAGDLDESDFREYEGDYE